MTIKKSPKDDSFHQVLETVTCHFGGLFGLWIHFYLGERIAPQHKTKTERLKPNDQTPRALLFRAFEQVAARGLRSQATWGSGANLPMAARSSRRPSERETDVGWGRRWLLAGREGGICGRTLREAIQLVCDAHGLFFLKAPQQVVSSVRICLSFQG